MQEDFFNRLLSVAQLRWAGGEREEDPNAQLRAAVLHADGKWLIH